MSSVILDVIGPFSLSSRATRGTWVLADATSSQASRQKPRSLASHDNRAVLLNRLGNVFVHDEPLAVDVLEYHSPTEIPHLDFP